MQQLKIVVNEYREIKKTQKDKKMKLIISMLSQLLPNVSQQQIRCVSSCTDCSEFICLIECLHEGTSLMDILSSYICKQELPSYFYTLLSECVFVFPNAIINICKTDSTATLNLFQAIIIYLPQHCTSSFLPSVQQILVLASHVVINYKAIKNKQLLTQAMECMRTILLSNNKLTIGVAKVVNAILQIQPWTCEKFQLVALEYQRNTQLWSQVMYSGMSRIKELIQPIKNIQNKSNYESKDGKSIFKSIAIFMNCTKWWQNPQLKEIMLDSALFLLAIKNKQTHSMMLPAIYALYLDKRINLCDIQNDIISNCLPIFCQPKEESKDKQKIQAIEEFFLSKMQVTKVIKTGLQEQYEFCFNRYKFEVSCNLMIRKFRRQYLSQCEIKEQQKEKNTLKQQVRQNIKTLLSLNESCSVSVRPVICYKILDLLSVYPPLLSKNPYLQEVTQKLLIQYLPYTLPHLQLILKYYVKEKQNAFEAVKSYAETQTNLCQQIAPIVLEGDFTLSQQIQLWKTLWDFVQDNNIKHILEGMCQWRDQMRNIHQKIISNSNLSNNYEFEEFIDQK